MRKLVFKIICENWCEIGPGDLEQTRWMIYDDLSMEIAEKYYGRKDKKYSTVLPKDKYDTINSLIDSIRNTTFEPIPACDGEAWEIIQLAGKKEVFHFGLGYIYGIKPLEELAHILQND